MDISVGNILAAALQRPILRSMLKAQLSRHQYSHSQSSPTKPTQTRRFPVLSEPWTRWTTIGDAPDLLTYLRKPVRPMSCPSYVLSVLCPVRPMSCPFCPTPLVCSSLFPMADAVGSVITCVPTSPQCLMSVYIPSDLMFSCF